MIQNAPYARFHSCPVPQQAARKEKAPGGISDSPHTQLTAMMPDEI